MSERKPVIKIYVKKKYIILNRPTIALLGNPPHLLFMFDEPNERLIILPAFEETLSTYEIPKYYWADKRQTCCICRLPFFLTLRQKLDWNGKKELYAFRGIFQILEKSQRLVIFYFTDADEIKINTKTQVQV